MYERKTRCTDACKCVSYSILGCAGHQADTFMRAFADACSGGYALFPRVLYHPPASTHRLIGNYGAGCRGHRLPKGLMTPIGKLIKDELQAQERSVSWFARKLHLDRSNVYRLFQKNSIDTDLLSRISIILGRNFFEPLSDNIRERNRTQE